MFVLPKLITIVSYSVEGDNILLSYFLEANAIGNDILLRSIVEESRSGT